MLTYFLLLLGLVILLFGGKILVDGASAIALKIGMSAGVIGMTVVAFGTSAPELLVSINAALKGNSDISIGNVVGSNIANIGMVLGISGMFYPILIKKSVLRFDFVLTLLVTLVFYVLSYNGIISFGEGLALFLFFIGFNTYLFLNSGQGALVQEDEDIINELEGVKKYSWLVSISLIFGGILGLYFGSELLVENAVIISREFGISERVIGISIIAIGTSLPELITSVMAALDKKTDLAIGNILGSNLMNILSIIGLTAIIKPIDISQEFLTSDYLWMIGFTLILLPLILRKMKISRVEGLILFIGYLTYMSFLL